MLTGRFAATAALAASLAGAGHARLPTAPEASSMTHATLARAPFGTLPDGRPVEIFTLTAPSGMEVRTIPYGAILVSLRVPDRDGRLGDVVLGFDSLDGYLERSPYFGAVVGRYGNRIAKGRFVLDGREYRLATNDGPNHLHGGLKGFDKKLWRAEPFQHGDEVGVVYRLTSPDGDEGYPGTLEARVTYTLKPSNELVVDYEATTDKPTVLNLTQHSYFNLAGEGHGDILGEELTIDADRFTPVDATMIPTGAIVPVKGTPFDFTRPTAIGARISAKDPQIEHGKGYDLNWVLNASGGGLHHVVRLVDPSSGRTLDVSTTQPGVQFYSGNLLNDVAGKGGHVYRPRSGLCLETQHFPDSPNHPDFPSTTLRPGETYRSTTVFAFGVTR